MHNPTARWVCQYFMGIHLLRIRGEGACVLNLNAQHQQLLRLLGRPYDVLLTRLGNSLSNSMILLVQEIDIANLGDIYHLDPSGGSRDAENPEEPS